MTVALVVANALVFLWQLTLSEAELHHLVLSAGTIPQEITQWHDRPPADLVPLPFTIFTAMFLHGGFMHLAGNMWFLWIFGDNVEDRLGRLRFAIFYLVTGVVAALAQCALLPDSPAPMIGASGAIAGVLGGYILLFPHSRVLSLIPIPLFWQVVAVPAWIFLGIWFVGQFLLGAGSGVAWMAHVGGFLAGLGLVRLFAPELRPRQVAAEYIPPPRSRN